VRRAAGVLVVVALTAPAHAIRPFITDDARVVGAHLLQLETWMQVDSTQAQHWVLPAFGPTDHIELTLGAVHGASYSDGPARYAIAGPLVQGKLLVREAHRNGAPGVALAAGYVSPAGRGGFETAQGAGFLYLALTESIGEHERLLVHANVGLSVGGHWMTATGGIGAQVRVIRGFHLVGEVVHGDAYAGDTGGAVQGGFRYIFNDRIQMDGTAGVGIWGDERRPPWGSLGLRVVSGRLW
jgi:hypothetical protein